ncbi:3-isopropylmalate dehydrogenase [Tissierella creatinini]|nr:3-isopropylmalate dehydrogenase [Tissierella creatinini]TJX63760.1 3-isopropylmalate dehydrogenase [Soehngenia saccharolytica]
MEYNIAVVKGDGIGPEVVDSTIEILDLIGEKFGHKFSYTEVLAGGCAYDVYGEPLPKSTIDVCRNSQAVLLGAVGGNKWDDLPGDKRPERAILGLRKELGLFANLRPGMLFKALEESCPLKAEIVGDGFDILVVRELTGGIYFGERGIKDTENGKTAYDIESYSEMEVRRIAHIGFEMAMKRNKKLTSVDKSNVLESSRLWRKTVIEVSKDYPEVELNHMYVDNASMQVIRNPKQFDVLLTTNLFGDILSDEISMLTGSIGMLPSASLGTGTGLFEPIHGSAPDIAGKGIANPIATILSAAMMLRFVFDLKAEADCIESAIDKVLNEGHRTGDIAKKGEKVLSTVEMTEVIKDVIKRG